MRRTSFAALLALPLAVLAGPAAQAAAYAFSSSGSFANASGASISNTGTKLGWGGTNSVNSQNYNGSSLTALGLSNQTGSTPGTQVTIGRLTWFNATTSSDNTAQNVTADYKLALAVSQPNPGANGLESFDLSITNTYNNARVCVFVIFCSNTGDVDDTTKVSNYNPSFVIDGLVFSNLNFKTTDGDSEFNNVSDVWTNPEGNTAYLSILADISVLPVAVPEPVSLALLGTGLVGLGLISRRGRRAA